MEYCKCIFFVQLNFRASIPKRHIRVVKIFAQIPFDSISSKFLLTSNFGSSEVLYEMRENMYCAKMLRLQ